MTACSTADLAPPASSCEEVPNVTLAQAFLKELQARAARLPHRDGKVCDAVCVQFELVAPEELGGSLREALAEGVRCRDAGRTDTESGAQAYGHFHRMLRIAGLDAPRGVATTIWLLLASGYADVQEVFEGYFNGDNDAFRPRKGWPGRSKTAA